MTPTPVPPSAAPPAAPPGGARSIAERSINGAAWMFGRTLLARVISLVAMAILARQLTPEMFGLAALASVLLLWMTATGETGISAYLIVSESEGVEELANGAFWLQTIITAVQATIAWLAIPLLERLYPDAPLRPLLLALIAVFVIRSMAAVPEALIAKRLQHKLLALRDSALDVGTAAASVALALADYGVWSLILPSLLVQPVRLGLTLHLARWRPAFRAHTRLWRPMLHFSTHSLATNFLALAINEGDTLLIGRLLGTASLGLYNLAWQLSNIIGRTITSVVASMSLSALAMLKGEPDRLQASYMRILGVIAALVLPALCGLFVVADDVVHVVYGPTWAASVPILRALIVFTAVRACTSPAGNLFSIAGKPQLGTKLNLATAPVYLAAIYFGARWGIFGVAVAVSAVRTVGGLAAFTMSIRAIGGRAAVAAGRVAPVLAVALGMAAVVAAADAMLRLAPVPAIVRLAILVPLGTVVYGVALAQFAAPTYAEIVRILGHVLPASVRRRLGGGSGAAPAVV